MRGKSCDCRWHDSSRKGVKDASFFLTQSHKATKNGSVFPLRIHERPSFLFGVDPSLPSSCLRVRFDTSTSTATASKLVSVSVIPAREDAVPSNLHYQSKLVQMLSTTGNIERARSSEKIQPQINAKADANRSGTVDKDESIDLFPLITL